jgi:hypothetical protein
MLLSLDVLRARKGDCLILHYGTQDDPHLVMIDGGPRGVYGPSLKPRIETIREARGLEKNAQIPVDLLMVSHVDDDHIQGILDLTRDLIQDDTHLARVLRVWHNSFENLIGDTPKELTAAFTSQFGAASMGGDPPDLTLDSEEDEEVVVSGLKVLASLQQGAQLRSDVVNKLGAALNPGFPGGLILAREKAFDMGNGLKLTVAGPMTPELQELHKKHQAWLKELAKEGKTPEDVLSAYVDKSVTNLSSLVVLAEAGEENNKKRMLLTGDARGDKILEGLELVGLLDKGGTMHVDLLKVPHHGSSNNLEDDFFERITADHYVFSGDGEHGNPERESLEMLLNARGDDDYTIHLTYPIDDIDKERKKDWEKEQAKEKARQAKNPAKEVRPDWSPKEHGLRAFFDGHPNFAKKVSVVEEDEPHVIDLLDKVGF